MLSAAAFFIAAAFLCMRFYNISSYKTPENPFSALSESLAAEDTQGGEGYQTSSLPQEESSAPDSTEDSSQPEDTDSSDSSQDMTESSRPQPEQPEQLQRNDGNSPAMNGENTNTAIDITGENKSDEIKKKPDSKTETVTKDTDTEYFTTSIKDGERVKKALYSFDITHRNKALTVQKVQVTVNGSEINQFSGSVTLHAGKNTIRVACTYTDKNSQVKRAYKDYTVYLETQEITFDTDLSDMDTDSESITFSAAAYVGSEKIPLAVTVNGEKLSGENSYTAQLENGENVITLSAEKDGSKAEKSFKIKYTPAEFSIDTDLYDRTVNNSDFSFYARMKGQSSSAKLSVVFNGKKLSGNGSYSCILQNGDNRIRLYAKDGEKKIDEYFTITFIPLADETTRPQITYINITDGQTVKGSGYTLRFNAQDYQGGRIYSDKTEVWLNGLSLECIAQDRNSAYYMELSGGANLLEIRIYDREGRYADYAYTINSVSAQKGEQTGVVKLSVDADTIGLGQLCAQSEVAIYEGDSGVDVIERFLEQNGFTADFSGEKDQRYLQRIHKSGAFAGGAINSELAELIKNDGIGESGISNADSLGEFDYTYGSGWVYTVNGNMPAYGMGKVNFTDGDTVRLAFTVAYGRDITGAQGSYDKTW